MRSTVQGTVCAMVLVWALCPHVCQAVLTLELSSSPGLLDLSVGDPVQIQVSLLGLEPGEELESLTSVVFFPGSILGAPTAIDPGPIIPDPLDFLAIPFAGEANGSFLTFTAQHIVDNGLFYTFDVTAQAPGSGVFTFLVPNQGTLDALEAEQFNPDPDPNALPILREVVAGADLPFRVTGPVGVIPEPLTATLGLMGLAALGVAIRRKGA